MGVGQDGGADGTEPQHQPLCLPLFSFQATFLFSLIKYTPLTYNKKYTYPWWGDALGWLLALSSMICIPAWSIYKLRTLKGPLREVGGKQWDRTSLDKWVLGGRQVASHGSWCIKGTPPSLVWVPRFQRSSPWGS